jgi:hypothetical protein
VEIYVLCAVDRKNNQLQIESRIKTMCACGCALFLARMYSAAP